MSDPRPYADVVISIAETRIRHLEWTYNTLSDTTYESPEAQLHFQQYLQELLDQIEALRRKIVEVRAGAMAESLARMLERPQPQLTASPVSGTNNRLAH